ncbi:MAG: neutral zinc metallopeptidase [Rhodothermales bacterium]|nr:neutral zinc metallopeptidase [Rhodothermales bacterium]
MKWRSGRRSRNIEDRRGRRGGIAARPATRVGGGFIVIALLAVLFLGEDAGKLLEVVGGAGPTVAETGRGTEQPADELGEFVAVVLADTEDAWSSIFSRYDSRYVEPTLVLFTDVVQSACGMNTAATGPFYCPADNKVYLDLGFLGQLRRFGASGDFALAYVIAHEVGHHIQALTGTEREVRRLQARVSEVDRNRLSVLMELQADCYAGVWAKTANNLRGILEEGDLEEALNAAASIGDDRLQRMSGRRVQPEAFTHGTSAQRVQWFRTGFSTGTIEACDTFAQATR